MLTELIVQAQFARFGALVEELRRERVAYALQNYGEFACWLALLAAIGPVRGVEIGTWFGGTTALSLAALPSIETLVTIDVDDRADMLSGLLGADGHRAKMVVGDSRAAATRLAVERALGGCQADFLFIDGDHSYGGVAGDFADYRPLVRRGGLIGVHDIAANRLLAAADTAGVERFWNELAAAEPDNCTSFVRDFGIGVFRVP